VRSCAHPISFCRMQILAQQPQAGPRYVQVKQFILRQISGGALRAGARVPSENELVRELDVARMTANRALRELAADGVLVRVAGVGTFVAEQRVHSHPLEVRNIADEIRSRGHEHEAKVVFLGAISATREIGERCGVTAGARLDHSLLIHFEGGAPLQVEDRYVNPTVVSGYLRNDFTRVTPHEFLMQAAPLQRAEHTVRAVIPEGRIRRMLKLDATDACLLIRRRTWAGGRIATVADLYHPGSRYELAGAFQARA
jgi:GntR family transcriptional regulator, histidine utilization repressor